MWDTQRKIWEEVAEKLPVQKYAHSVHSEHSDKRTVTLLKNQKMAEWYGLKKDLMPLPNTALAFPMFRYLLFSDFFCFIAEMKVFNTHNFDLVNLN